MGLCRNIIVPLALLLFVACNSSGEHGRIVDVDPSGWYAPTEITFEVAENSPRVDMKILLRYDNAVTADSVELLVSTIAPDGVKWTEPLVIYTPRTNRSIYTTESPYRLNVEWQQSGTYQVLLHPQHLYRGVTAAGVTFSQIDI